MDPIIIRNLYFQPLLPHPVYCQLGNFYDTTGCSVNCGGGMKQQRRNVLTQPSNGVSFYRKFACLLKVGFVFFNTGFVLQYICSMRLQAPLLVVQLLRVYYVTLMPAHSVCFWYELHSRSRFGCCCLFLVCSLDTAVYCQLSAFYPSTSCSARYSYFYCSCDTIFTCRQTSSNFLY